MVVVPTDQLEIILQETINTFMEKLDDIAEAVRDLNHIEVIDSDTRHNILEISCSVHKIAEEFENLNKVAMLIYEVMERNSKQNS